MANQFCFLSILDACFSFAFADFEDPRPLPPEVVQELSDVLLYLLRLADKAQIDLPQAALDKLSLNAAKYPAKLVKGSSKKYNEY